MNKVNKSLRFAVPSPLEAASRPLPHRAVAIQFVVSIWVGSSPIHTHVATVLTMTAVPTQAIVIKE